MKKYMVTLVWVLCISDLSAFTVTSLNGTYKNGQVLITWKNPESPNTWYKLYRSDAPIAETANLSASTCLGMVFCNSSLNQRRTDIEGTPVFISIDSGLTTLTAQDGLFVITSSSNQSWYYAITTVTSGVEDSTIMQGENALIIPVEEYIALPLPYFQQTIILNGITVEVYLHFATQSENIYYPAMSNVGCIPYNIAVCRNGNTSGRPLVVFLHGGGGDLYDGIDNIIDNEVRLSLDDRTPNNHTTLWYGYNRTLDVYSSKNPIPTSDTNMNYTQRRITWAIDWAIKHLPIDSHRISIKGTSMGAGGAISYALNYPERIAAVYASVPKVIEAFDADFNSACDYNEGKKGRLAMDSLMGKAATDLPCNYLDLLYYSDRDYSTFIHTFKSKSFPVFYLVNGKNDTKVGWTEKTIYYDSVNNNKLGGYYFWDQRTHGGGGTWKNNFDLLRYRNNESYPAFSFCSLNEDPGNGAATNGAPIGSINGFLDWAPASIDIETAWEIPLCMHALETTDMVISAPDSCTVDVTPRRLQQFEVPNNTKLYWRTTHTGAIIQSDSFIYNSGPIVIPGVKIFPDTIVLRVYYNASPLSLSLSSVNSTCELSGSAAVSITGGNPPYYVQWSNGDTSTNITLPPGNHFVSVTDAVGNYADTSFEITGAATLMATINPPGDNAFCKGIPFALQEVAGMATQWQWYKNSAVISGETNSTYSPIKTAVYTVGVSNENCSVLAPPVSITLNAVPVSTINPAGTISICNGNSELLAANTNMENATYQWRKNGVNIAGATQVTYAATQAGNYSVKVIAESGCSKNSAVTKIQINCKESYITNNEMFTASANPYNGILEIIFHTSGTGQLSLFDMLGRSVYNKTTATEINTSIKITTHKLVSGIYFLCWQSNSELQIEKITFH